MPHAVGRGHSRIHVESTNIGLEATVTPVPVRVCHHFAISRSRSNIDCTTVARGIQCFKSGFQFEL
jgi:hypothetical protein